MDLLGAPTRLKSDRVGLREEVLGPRQGVVVVVGLVRVDLGFGPVEDPELVVGSHVDERDRDGARPGLPVWGGGEEDVADEVAVGGVCRGVDPQPVEMRRRGDAGPLDRDRVARFGDGFWGDGDGDLGCGLGEEVGEE